MAPIKPRAGPAKGKRVTNSKSKSGPSSKPTKSSSLSKPSQVKTKPTSAPHKKKQRVYTDKELGIPQLNMITPAGVQKPKGKKKGKVFVDDQESMMTILAMVNADKEGQIESKMMKARQMEEIREARRKEAEARQEEKRSKLEETKDALRKRRKHKLDTTIPEAADYVKAPKPSKPGKKRVSFG